MSSATYTAEQLKVLVCTGDLEKDSRVFAVIDALEDEYSGNGTVYAPRGIARKTKLTLEEVDRCLAQLSDDPTFALTIEWYFDDSDGYNVETWKISATEAQAAMDAGEFFHPESGEEVPDFRKRIHRCFLSDRFAPLRKD